MKTKLEWFTHGLILAPVAPLVGLLGGWWTAYALLPEKWIPFVSLAGLLAGILADVLLLKKVLDRRQTWLFWMAVFLFYSIGTFGFSMGVPVLNAALAIPAGFVAGSRLAEDNIDRQHVRRTARRTAWFTSGVLALVCAVSASLALASPSTASDLRGMLGLGFAVTQEMILALILVGGAALLAACWGLTFAAVRLTYHFIRKQA